MKTYPDISSILEAKMRRRQYLARLSFEEKIAIVEKWRALTKQISNLRPLKDQIKKSKIQ